MDDKTKESKAKNEWRPGTIETDLYGTYPAGHYVDAAEGIQMPSPDVAKLWIERKDQAKQSNARKVNMRDAVAAPDHPHTGMLPTRGLTDPTGEE